MNDDEFLRTHRALHEQQRARLVLVNVFVGIGFLIVVLMLVIAFKPV